MSLSLHQGYQTLESSEAVDTRRWAQTSPSPVQREQPDPLSPPSSEDGQRYGQTTPQREERGEPEAD